MNVSKREPEMFILINHNFTIISLLHCANSKPKFRNQFMTQLTVRNKNCILRDNIMHIQSLHFNTFIISCEIRSDFPLSVSTDRNGPTFILICCRSLMPSVLWNLSSDIYMCWNCILLCTPWKKTYQITQPKTYQCTLKLLPACNLNWK